MLLDLDLHQYKNDLLVKKGKDGVWLWDPVRKKYIRLQPEELVRQLMIQYLIQTMKYPLNYFQIEKGMQVHQLQKRFDLLVMDRRIKPFLLIEFKSHKIPLKQETFDQVSHYNQKIQAPYLMVTNGIHSICAHINQDTKTYRFVDIPSFPEI